MTRINDDVVLSTGEKADTAPVGVFTSTLATLEESLSSVPHFSVINSRQLAIFYLTLNRGAPLAAFTAADLFTCRRKST